MMSRRISLISTISVPAEVEASASGSAWVSDLELCDGALELAGALRSGSGCESGLPKRTSITSPSTTIGSSSSGSPSSVMSAKCRVRPSRTASVRFGSSDVTVSIPSASSLSRPHLCTIALVQAVPHVHPFCLVASTRKVRECKQIPPFSGESDRIVPCSLLSDRE